MQDSQVPPIKQTKSANFSTKGATAVDRAAERAADKAEKAEKAADKLADKAAKSLKHAKIAEFAGITLESSAKATISAAAGAAASISAASISAASSAAAAAVSSETTSFAPPDERFGFAPPGEPSASGEPGESSANGESSATAGIPVSLEGAPESIQSAAPSDGIEILCKLAESGEIDPKNVDIIDVTDKFLKAIAAAPKENLRQSGKVLFHACVLLRMKAEALLAVANAELDPGDDFLDFDDSDGLTIYDSRNQPVARQITLLDLERALVRKASVRPNRQRRVTLDQLILALRQAEQIEKIRAEKQPRAPRIELAGHHEVNEYDDILDLAHDEDIESTIVRVEGILLEYVQSGQLMHLFHIVRLLDRHGDWVDAFLAVLFLSNAGKISLEQESFWGPLYVVRCDQEPQQASSAGNHNVESKN